MSLQYTAGPDFQGGTLASGYTAGGSSLALTATHGARFPSSGDFWVRVEDEVFKVTARTTDTLTVHRAQDSTAAANHAAGTDVYWVLGVAALNQLRTDITGGAGKSTMTVAAFDSATTNGTVQGGLSHVRMSNGIYECIWNGSAWEYYFGHVKCARPFSSAFSWVNQGSATVSGATGGVYMASPGSASIDWHLMAQSATPPYTLRVGFKITGPSVNYLNAGVGWRNSGGAQLIAVAPGFGASGYHWRILLYNSPTSFSTFYLDEKQRQEQFDVVWLRLVDDNTNRIVSTSADGLNWVQVLSHGRTSGLNPNQVWFGLSIESASYSAGMTLIDWTVS